MIEVLVFTKIFSREFYRLNAGFFLVVIGVCGGFLRDVEHIALAQFFVGTTWSIFIPVIVWILYTLKVVLFNKSILQKPENEFSYSIRLFPSSNIAVCLLITLFTQLAPIFVYAVFLIIVSLWNGLLYPVLVMTLSLAGLLFSSAYMLRRDFAGGKSAPKILWLKQWLDRQYSRPYVMMAIEWIARYEPFTLIGSKLFSYLVIYGILYLYRHETYDIRLMTIGVCFAFSSNIILLFHIHTFENQHLSICRNLPLKITIRIRDVLGMIVLLSLPETGLLVTGMSSYFSLPETIVTVLFGWSLLILFYAIQFLHDWGLEGLIRRSFFLIILFFLMILFKVPVIAILTGNIVIGILLWKRNYYSFEYISKE